MCIDIYAMVSLLNHLYLDGGLETKEDLNLKKLIKNIKCKHDCFESDK
jgi:hypothetical protein